MEIKRIGAAIINNWPAKLLSLAFAVLLFYFYKINTTEVRYISVPLEIMINSSYIPAESYPSEVRIALRGNSEIISIISEKDIAAYVDFSNRQTVGTYREPIKVRKSGNALYAEPLELRIEPSEIKLKIEEKLVKNLPIVASTQGFPAENYELVSYSISPDNTTVEGPLSVMEKINMLKTEVINMDGRKESFDMPVKIEQTNRLLVFVEGNEVLFRGRIERSLISKNIAPVKIELKNNSDDFAYDIEFHSGSIRIEAERRIIDNFTRDNCLLYIDTADVKAPGTYNLPVSVQMPEAEGEVYLGSFAPETIKVEVTQIYERGRN